MDLPFAGTGQLVHDEPQLLTLALETHVEPQSCMPAAQVTGQLEALAMQAPLHNLKPALQVTPQDEPLQVATPFCGTGHGEQEEPQLLTLALETQVEPQLCMPAAQVTGQLEVLAMQAPLHNLKPALQVPPQDEPLQVATPFCGTGHVEQEEPQALTLVFAGHMPLQL